MRRSRLIRHDPVHKGFRRFATIVMLASITWCALFLKESNYLSKSNYFFSNDYNDGPSQTGSYEWKEHNQNLRSESKYENFMKPLGDNRYNTTSSSNANEKEAKWTNDNEVSSNPLQFNENTFIITSNELESKSVVQNQRQHTFPRTMTLDKPFGDSSIPKHKPMPYQKEPEKHPILDEYMPRSWERDIDKLDYYLTGQFTEDFQSHCVDMKEWQSKSYPVCNSIHELGVLGGSATAVSEMHYIGTGAYRSTHFIPNQHAIPDSLEPDFVVLKLLHLEKENEIPFDPRAFEMHRVDALISQKMTASPYVLDIYGYCGMSSIYEKGVANLNHDARYREDIHNRDYEYPIPDAKKVLYASHVAKGLLDLHGADYPDNRYNTTIVHADIKPDNILMVRRPWGLVAKLGDFNNSFLRKWNRTSNTPCPLYMNAVPAVWGGGYMPPEQSAGKPIDGSVDVFAFGAILYYLLLGQVPREQYPQDTAAEAIASGELPPLPPPLNYGHSNYTGSTTSNDEKIDAKTYHQSFPNNGDTAIVNDIIKGIEAHMKVKQEERPPIELPNTMFESYNTCAGWDCSKSHWLTRNASVSE